MEYAIESPDENSVLGREAFIASKSIWRRRVNVSMLTPIQSVAMTQSTIKRLMTEMADEFDGLSLAHDIEDGEVSFPVMLLVDLVAGCC